MSIRAGALLGAALLLASCGSGGSGTAAVEESSGSSPAAPQLFPDDFEGVCSGASQSRGTDYASSAHHKALYFETYEDDLLDQSDRLPSDWTVQFDANSNAYMAVDVVACGIRVDEKLAKRCTGYEDDETGTKGSVNWYTGTYDLTAYEARTGKRLDSTTIEADSEECPLVATFDDGEDESDMYASPTDQEIAKFLEKIVKP
jgi:hypothetical protein